MSEGSREAIVPFLAFFAWLINGTRFSQLELASVALVATGAIGGVLVSSEGLSGSPGSITRWNNEMVHVLKPDLPTYSGKYVLNSIAEDFSEFLRVW